MYRKEELAREFRKCFPDWTEERIEEHAEFLAGKFATLKKGPNIIHLTYYSQLIRPDDIQEVERMLAVAGLELSHFDRTNAAYSPALDYDLDFALHIHAPMMQQILNHSDHTMAWDTIKLIALFIREKLHRYWSQLPEADKPNAYTFGLKISTNVFSRINLQLHMDADIQTTHEALDKVINLVRTAGTDDNADRLKHYHFNKEQLQWIETRITGKC